MVTLAVLLGRRWLRLDAQSAILIGAGSAICGAAAVLASAPVVRANPDKGAVAVATVVLFGALAMFGYPLLHTLLPGLTPNDAAYGVYVGSTVHEVAQVVVAARSVSEAAAAQAVIAKMMRVMMLAPFLLVLSVRGARGAGAARKSRQPRRSQRSGSDRPSGTITAWGAVGTGGT